MKITEIESFEDCSTVIIYSNVEEFRTWMVQNDQSEASQEDLTEEWVSSMEMVFGLCTKIVRDFHYVHVIWISETEKQSPVQKISTISHESTHMVDNLELFICNRMGMNSGSERIPRELRARIVESLVATGTRMIVGEIPDGIAA